MASTPIPRLPSAGGGGGEEELPRMTLLEHLEELRKRLIYSLAAVAIGFGACWGFHDQLFDYLERPILRFLPEGEKLAVFGVPDAFFIYIKVSVLAGLFVAAPFVLYQVWAFVAPGLYRRERRGAATFVIAGSLFFIAGGAFAYLVAVPFAIEFLLSQAGEHFQAVIGVSQFLRFEMTLILGLGLMFELPIALFALAQVGIVTPGMLLRNFRWAVLLIFVAAAIITPTPDVFNLMIFALPTIVLYLLGVAAAAVVVRRKKTAAAEPEAG